MQNLNKSLLTRKDLADFSHLKTQTVNSLFYFNIAINRHGFCLNEDANDYLNFETDNKVINSKIFHSFLPDLSFTEVYRLSLIEKLFNKEDLWKLYQIPFSEKLEKMMVLLLETSAITQKWLSEKKIRPHELYFLLNLSAPQGIDLLESISQSTLSKSQALQFLEWSCDILLLKISIPENLKSKISESSLLELKNLRFPKSFMQHPLLEKKLNWGTGIQAQFQRKQDRAGFQIQFFVSTPEELGKVILNLQKSQNEWAQQ